MQSLTDVVENQERQSGNDVILLVYWIIYTPIT